ncbi:hypothetical protein [Rhodanobacter lindaniclasticus]
MSRGAYLGGVCRRLRASLAIMLACALGIALGGVVVVVERRLGRNGTATPGRSA